MPAPVDEKIFVTDDVLVLFHNLERIRGLADVCAIGHGSADAVRGMLRRPALLCHQRRNVEFFPSPCAALLTFPNRQRQTFVWMNCKRPWSRISRLFICGRGAVSKGRDGTHELVILSAAGRYQKLRQIRTFSLDVRSSSTRVPTP